MPLESPMAGALPPDNDRNMATTYVAVLILEAIVLTGLWAFSRYFA